MLENSVRVLKQQSLRWVGLRLAHCGWVTPIFVSNLNITGLDNGLSPGRPLSEPMLEYCKFEPWKQTINLKQNSYMFIQEYAFEHIVWKQQPHCLATMTPMGTKYSQRVSRPGMRFYALSAVAVKASLVLKQYRFIHILSHRYKLPSGTKPHGYVAP